ncbi:MAG: hypothetical protein UZ18_ATM001000018, partial [Armatimonadetes bacterium OLB18]
RTQARARFPFWRAGCSSSLAVAGDTNFLALSGGPGSARAEVAYIFPYRGLVISMLWSVRKEGRSWRVDADETLRNLPRAVGVSSLDELTH